MVPFPSIVIVAVLFAEVEVPARQRMPAGPAVHLAVYVPPVAASQGFGFSTPAAAGGLGAPPMSEAANVAHSLASPSASPMAAPAWAAFRACRYCGSATAERMPITATTIISSTNVNPLVSLLELACCCLSCRMMAIFMLVLMVRDFKSTPISVPLLAVMSRLAAVSSHETLRSIAFMANSSRSNVFAPLTLARTRVSSSRKRGYW